MKIHYMSDLHLEFSSMHPIQTDADIIVLAGDIWKGDRGIGWARNAYTGKQIIYVPGNHEFYGTQRLDTLAKMRIAARECDVNLLDNDELIVGDVRFLGATLWTDFKLFGEAKKQEAMAIGQFYLRDFQVIHEGAKGHFSPSHSIELHEMSLTWLKNKLAEPFHGKTVVVTHHLPCRESVVKRFRDDVISACFASDLDIVGKPVDLWIHGHTHDNLDFEKEGTRVVCNPRGYVTSSHSENFDFDPVKIVEV